MNEFQEEKEENYVPTIDFSGLSIYHPRQPKTKSEYVSMKKMGDSQRSEADFAHELELDSLVRQYVPPPEVVHHFFLTKQNVTEKQSATMNESVDTYIDQLKKTLPPLQHRISPRFMETNEVPLGFSMNTKPPKRRIARIFDRTQYYESRQPKLSSNLPDIYITQQFKEYVMKSDERIPQILLEADISPPQGIKSKSPRRKGKRRALIPRCAAQTSPR